MKKTKTQSKNPFDLVHINIAKQRLREEAKIAKQDERQRLREEAKQSIKVLGYPNGIKIKQIKN